MSMVETIDWITLQSRLLSNASLRHQFSQDRIMMARQQRLRQNDFPLLSKVRIEDLEEQAKTLITKRLHAVKQLMPCTFRSLDRSAERLFRKYSEKYWPQGHRGHTLDAAEFCKYLDANKTSGRCKVEVNLYRFVVDKVLFRIHAVSDLHIKNSRHRGIQILFRWRGRVRNFCWYLAFL